MTIMKMHTLCCFMLLCFTSSSVAAVGYTRVVDLTQLMNADAYKWPIYNLTFDLRPYLDLHVMEGVTAYGFDLHFSEHTGTHMDAPTHFTVDGTDQWSTHQIPADRLVGKLHVINVADKAAKTPDYEVTPADIEAYEEKYGKIQPRSIVLLDIDWAKHWSNPKAYFGAEDVTDPATFRFPGMGLETCKLLAERDILGYGAQTASAERPTNENYGCHVHLLQRNIWLLENVGDMSELPPGGGDTILTVGVMNTEGGTGGPVRLLALVNDNGDSAASSVSLSITSLCVAVIIYIFF